MNGRTALRTSGSWRRLLPAVCGVLLFALLAGGVFLFSPHTRVQALVCQGNYYYSPQQVYSIAQVSVDSRTFLNSVSEIENRLKSNPLIENASVSRDGQQLTISIEEKNIIGYYEKDGTNYLVTSAGEHIPVSNETELRTLVHFPLMADLDEATIDAIAGQAAAHPDQLNRQAFEKIAEILPWSESYDKNMLKLVLQDGNTVFTSIPSLFMMSAYPQVLEQLRGQNVCLTLDGENGVVNKVACDYMYLSPEQRAGSREIPKSVLSFPYPSSSQTSLREDEEKDSEDSPAERDGQQVPSEETPPDPHTVQDWEASAVDFMLYSPSTNTFKSVADGTLYMYDAPTDTFLPLQ